MGINYLVFATFCLSGNCSEIFRCIRAVFQLCVLVPGEGGTLAEVVILLYLWKRDMFVLRLENRTAPFTYEPGFRSRSRNGR